MKPYLLVLALVDDFLPPFFPGALPMLLSGRLFPEGCCRIKYIGRNCRVVLVGDILLKAEQEVAAGPGTKVILNFNNKVMTTTFNRWHVRVASYIITSLTKK